jgi:hypothetical protein
VRRNPLSSVRPSDSFFVRLLASLLLIRLGFFVLRLAARRAFR